MCSCRTNLVSRLLSKSIKDGASFSGSRKIPHSHLPQQDTSFASISTLSNLKVAGERYDLGSTPAMSRIRWAKKVSCTVATLPLVFLSANPKDHKWKSTCIHGQPNKRCCETKGAVLHYFAQIQQDGKVDS